MKTVTGGVCAPKGFKAAGIHCGVKASSSPDKKDLAMILSACECTAAAVYTMNRVKAAPIYVTMEHLEQGTAWGVLVNSGNANACAPHGHENAEEMCLAAAVATQRNSKDFIVASTGVIGQTLNIDAIKNGMAELVANLSETGSDDAEDAIMTTDTVPKQTAIELEIGGKTVKIGAICKGAGMIAPNMGTMLCFITTDCAITHEMLQEALHEVVPRTFNRVTVDGDTSTNDMCTVMANGLAGNEQIEWKDEDYELFLAGLHQVCQTLAKAIAADGEGATKLVSCTVSGARNEETAERLARAVVGSSLTKAAMFGADANWGRVLCAMGYSKAPFRPEFVDVSFRSEAGTILVCQQGAGLEFDEGLAKKILTEKEVEILVELHEADSEATCWGCDLTYDYVKINGDYRT